MTDFLKGIYLSTEQGPIVLDFKRIMVPTLDDMEIMRESHIELAGQLPATTQQLQFQWNEIYGAVIIRVDGINGEALHSAYLQAGELSDGIKLTTRSTMDVVKNYIHSGFIHIIPRGLDHILFVLGLFLFSTRWRPLTLQVSIFTLAHTITLAMGSTGTLNISPDILEPLIALSIVVVALENLWRQKIHHLRLLIIFAFGLLHGLGFASVLADVGLSSTHFVTALLSFNVGVELGQLLVLALASVSVYWCTKKAWYRSVIVVPGSLAIAATGAWWFVQRVS